MKNPFSLTSNQTGSAHCLGPADACRCDHHRVTSISTSNTELQISTRMPVIKSLLRRGRGTEFGAQLLEENIACPAGFSISTVGDIEVDTPSLWMNASASKPSDTNRDFYYPSGYSAGELTPI